MILLAELVDFQRFRTSRELMASVGVVPSEYSSGDTHRQGRITKAGNAHVRRILVEAAWHYRHGPRLGRAIARRIQHQPPAIVAHAWKAQPRLRRRDRHLVGHGKRAPIAIIAVARELVGFLWAAMTRVDTSDIAAERLVNPSPHREWNDLPEARRRQDDAGTIGESSAQPLRRPLRRLALPETEAAPDEPRSCGSALRGNPRISG
jgi:hypothetical protein